MEPLPPYFKEYMEQKFKAVDEQFVDIKGTLNTALNNHDSEISDLKEEVRWLNQKVWMAIGALTVISLVGGIFAAYFKQLNKAQISEVVSDALQNYKGVVDVYGTK